LSAKLYSMGSNEKLSMVKSAARHIAGKVSNMDLSGEDIYKLVLAYGKMCYNEGYARKGSEIRAFRSKRAQTENAAFNVELERIEDMINTNKQK